MIESLLKARRILHGLSPAGDNICTSCGLSCNGAKVASAIGDSFTTISELRLLPSEFICEGCAGLLKDAHLRYWAVLKVPGQELVQVKREIMYEALMSQPGEFVTTWPITRKKHAWLYCGVSYPGCWNVGSDSRTIVYDQSIHEQVRSMVFALLNQAIPQTAIQSGIYHPAFQSKNLALIERAEAIIANHRASGLVDFLLFIGPRQKSPLEERIVSMIDPQDELASQFLETLAKHSRFRIEQGMQFWGGFFDARIERVRNISLPDQATRLMQYIGVDAHRSLEVTEFLQGLTPEQTADIETAIRKRPKLIVALTYSRLKKSKIEKDIAKAAAKQTTEVPASGGLFQQ